MAKDEESDEESPPVGPSLARLERLARLMRQQGHAEGLNPVQWEALRYLKRSNGFSRSPKALARYLGTTKGTISQTLQSLKGKGLIQKLGSDEDGRAVRLELTEAGEALLAKDGLSGLARNIAELGPKTRKRFDRAVAILLAQEAERQNEPSFGSCVSCRYFREGGSGKADACQLLAIDLSPEAQTLLCFEHVER